MAAKMKGTHQVPLGSTVFLPAIPKMYHFSKYAPMADTCNSGPVIVLDHAGPTEETDNPVCKPKVVIRKCSGPPLWHATKPCSAPCCSAFIPAAALSCHDPLLPRQWRLRYHAGNLLQCLPTPDDNLQLFQAVNIEDGSIVCLYDMPLSCETQHSLIDRQMSFRKGYQIYDLQCTRVQNETFVLSRGSHRVDLHRLSNDSLEFRNAEWKSDVLLTGACLSQTFIDKWLETNENQEVSLKNCERTQPSIWSQNLPDCEVSGREKEWCSAVFAYEDCIAIATNRSKMYLCDFRKEKPDCLLDILHCKYGEKVDEICNMKRSHGTPYMFLVTSQHVWLVDERRCDQPVITWNHLLLDQPRRSVLQSLPGLDVFMLSNNLERRVAFASVQGLNILNETTECFVQSPLLIFHHDFMTPMKSFAHKKGLWFDHRVSERLSKYENSGLATAKSPVGGNFTVFSSNTAGDVFCQKFNLDKVSLDSQSTSENVPAVVKRMKAYERAAKKLFCKHRRDEQTLDVTSTMEEKLRLGNELPVNPPLWDVRGTVEKVKQSSSHTKALNGTMVFKWTDHLIEDYKDDSNSVSNADINETENVISKYFHPRTVEITSSEWLSSRGDELANKILNFWPLVDPNANDLMASCGEVDKDPEYRSVPYGKKFGRSDYVRKCRPRSSNGSTTERTSDGVSSGASFDSRSVSGYSGSRMTLDSSFSGGSRSATDVGEHSKPLSQELLDASGAMPLLSTLSATPLPSTLSATPLPSTASQVLTPLFTQTPSSLMSTIKKKRRRNAGF